MDGYITDRWMNKKRVNIRKDQVDILMDSYILFRSMSSNLSLVKLVTLNNMSSVLTIKANQHSLMHIGTD